MKAKLSGLHPSRDASSVQQATPVVERGAVSSPSNRDLKYLLTNLRTCQNEGEKAQSMLAYLNGCSFNASESPDKIIRFSTDEATDLCQYITEVIESDGNVEEPEVRHNFLLRNKDKIRLCV